MNWNGRITEKRKQLGLSKIAALQYMISMCERNEVAGMVFALALKHKRIHPHLCGATGRLASDTVEAAGVASMLNFKMTQEAVHSSFNG